MLKNTPIPTPKGSRLAGAEQAHRQSEEARQRTRFLHAVNGVVSALGGAIYDPQTRAGLATGASTGIGAELADQFVRGGHDVVLVARREEKLHDLAASLEDRYDVTASVIVQDLAETDGAAQLSEAVRATSK